MQRPISIRPATRSISNKQIINPDRLGPAISASVAAILLASPCAWATGIESFDISGIIPQSEESVQAAKLARASQAADDER